MHAGKHNLAGLERRDDSAVQWHEVLSVAVHGDRLELESNRGPATWCCGAAGALGCCP
jgi:hypothetical protein